MQPRKLLLVAAEMAGRSIGAKEGRKEGGDGDNADTVRFS